MLSKIASFWSNDSKLHNANKLTIVQNQITDFERSLLIISYTRTTADITVIPM